MRLRMSALFTAVACVSCIFFSCALADAVTGRGELGVNNYQPSVLVVDAIDVPLAGRAVVFIMFGASYSSVSGADGYAIMHMYVNSDWNVEIEATGVPETDYDYFPDTSGSVPGRIGILKLK